MGWSLSLTKIIIFSEILVQSIPETEPDPYLPLFYVIRFILYAIRILLLTLGTINIFVIVQVIFRPYFRSISNVYLISLCAANFIYLLNLTAIMITRLVKGTFNSYTCMLITATEKIGKRKLIFEGSRRKFEEKKCTKLWILGKYLCVISVVLLAADRFWVICNRRTISRRYRTYKTAIITLTLIWILTILISLPPTLFSTPYKLHGPRGYQKLCLITWPMYFKM